MAPTRFPRGSAAKCAICRAIARPDPKERELISHRSSRQMGNRPAKQSYLLLSVCLIRHKRRPWIDVGEMRLQRIALMDAALQNVSESIGCVSRMIIAQAGAVY